MWSFYIGSINPTHLKVRVRLSKEHLYTTPTQRYCFKALTFEKKLKKKKTHCLSSLQFSRCKLEFWWKSQSYSKQTMFKKRLYFHRTWTWNFQKKFWHILRLSNIVAYCEASLKQLWTVLLKKKQMCEMDRKALKFMWSKIYI